MTYHVLEKVFFNLETTTLLIKTAITHLIKKGYYVFLVMDKEGEQKSSMVKTFWKSIMWR